MQLALATISILLAGTLILVGPGALLICLWRLDRVVPSPLIPACAATLSLLIIAAVTIVSLLGRLHIGFVATVMALVMAFMWFKVAQVNCRDRHDDRFSRTRPRLSLSDWLHPIANLALGQWLRATPLPALVAAMLGSMLAFMVGFFAWNDSLYHIAEAQKLLALDHPSFSNILQFPDGSAHPGYLVPAWHMMLALTAFVSRQDVVTVAWILPALTFPIALLACSGLAWTLFRARAAASVAPFSLLLLSVAGLPYSDVITNAIQPGVFALATAAPLVIAMLFTATWSEPAPGSVPTSSVERASVSLAMLATLTLGILHVSYLWVLGLGILGYYLLWILHSPWNRDQIWRHIKVGAAIFLVAGILVAALYPGLTSMEGLGRDAAAELAATDNSRYQGENDANLEALLRGDPAGNFHLRSDYLIQSGGLALLGIIGLILPLLLAPRWPGGWYLAGAALLVLLIALSDRIFPAFASLVTLDQARRVERVLPLALGLSAALLTAAAGISRLWQQPKMRIVATLLLVTTIGAVAAVTNAVPPLAGYGGEQIVSPRIMVLLLVVASGAAILHGSGLVVRLLRRQKDTTLAKWPTQIAASGTAFIALVVLHLGGAPVYAKLGSVPNTERLSATPITMRGAELRLFSNRVAAELRQLPAGSIVLADPRSRNPYVAMAIAPVYVVSSVPRHTALTPKNRVSQRFNVATEFFKDETTASRRLEILRQEKVDAVLVHPAASSQMRAQLDAMSSSVRMVATDKNQRLYLIDRSAFDH